MALFVIVVMLYMSMFRCIIGCSVDLWDLCSFSGTKWTIPSTGHYSQNPFTNDAISSWKIYSMTGKECCVTFWWHGPERVDPSHDLTQCAVNGGVKEVSCATSTNNDNGITQITVIQPTQSPTKNPTFHPTKKPTFKPTQKPTFKPTQKPTSKPTKIPTEAPTKPPTKLPTEAPSFEPTKTQYPSQFPTLSPSNNPALPPTTARVREAEVADDTTASPKRDVEDDSMETDKNNNEIILNMSKEIVIITLILFICSCLVCLCLLYKFVRTKRKAQDAIDALEIMKTNKNANAGEYRANTQDPPNVHQQQKQSPEDGPRVQKHAVGTHAIRLPSVPDVVINDYIRETRDGDPSMSEDSCLYHKDAEQTTAQTRAPYPSNSQCVPRVQTHGVDGHVIQSAADVDPFPLTTQDSDASEDKFLHLYDKNAKQTATQRSDCSARVCKDCGLMKEGKVYQDDGLFYCNECWKSYTR
eukprot:762475_1